MSLENQQKCHRANSFNSFFLFIVLSWDGLVQANPFETFDLQEGRCGLRSVNYLIMKKKRKKEAHHIHELQQIYTQLGRLSFAPSENEY